MIGTTSDYALLATNVDAVYSVELKTDQAFRREVQDAYPLAARKAGWDEILDGVLRIVRTTAPQYHPEYRHLLAQLEKVGAICVPAEMRRATPEGILRDLSDVVTRVRPEPAIEVLYVQPRATGVKTVIDSEEFGSALPADDPVAGVFREHLARWTEPAGAVHPQHVLEEGGG